MNRVNQVKARKEQKARTGAFLGSRGSKVLQHNLVHLVQSASMRLYNHLEAPHTEMIPGSMVHVGCWQMFGKKFHICGPINSSIGLYLARSRRAAAQLYVWAPALERRYYRKCSLEIGDYTIEAQKGAPTCS